MTTANGLADCRKSGGTGNREKPADAGRQAGEKTTPSLEDLAEAGAISTDFMEILQEMRNEDRAAIPAAPGDGNPGPAPAAGAGVPAKPPKE